VKLSQPDRCGWAATAVILLGSAIIILCARGELWFDEVLSLQWAKNAAAPWQLLTLYRHDNNHLLNTFWMWLVGPGAPELLLRSFSIACGVATLILLYLLAGLLSPRVRLVPLILAAGSYALVLYSSEARGYAPALASSLGCLWIWLRHEGRPTLGSVPAFWALALAGLLSHPSIVYVLAAIGCWQLCRKRESLRAWLGDLRAALWWLAVPGLLAVVLFFAFFRGMDVAGGPTLPPAVIAAEFFRYGLGLPGSENHPWATAVTGVFLILAALVWGVHRFSGQRVFFTAALLVLPGVAYWVAGREYVYFRYFLVCLPLLFLLLGCLAERLWSSSAGGRVLVAAAVSASLALQSPPLFELAWQGRGSCREVLATILRESKGSTDVFSDHDMMIGMVFEHYRAGWPDGSLLRYHTQWSMPTGTCEWLLAAPAAGPLAETREIEGRIFRHVRTFHRARVSGTDWILYRRDPM
jgi:hypothetical protein